MILVCDADTDAYIIAVDADSGKIAWKTPRDVINGYATPIIYRPSRGPAAGPARRYRHQRRQVVHVRRSRAIFLA